MASGLLAVLLSHNLSHMDVSKRKAAAYRWMADEVTRLWVPGMHVHFPEMDALDRAFVAAVEGWTGDPAGAQEVRTAGEALINAWRERVP